MAGRTPKGRRASVPNSAIPHPPQVKSDIEDPRVTSSFHDTVDMPVSQSSRAPTTKVPCRWGAVLTLCFPEGTARHPRVLDRVEQEIGRICAVDERVEGVRVSFGARGNSVEDALKDSGAVARTLLSLLDLPDGAIVEHQLLPRPNALAEHDRQVPLVLIQDLPLNPGTD